MYDPVRMQFLPQPWFGFARTKELRGSSQPQVRGQKSRALNPMSSLSWQYLATSAQDGAMHEPDAASPAWISTSEFGYRRGHGGARNFISTRVVAERFRRRAAPTAGVPRYRVADSPANLQVELKLQVERVLAA